MPTMELALRRSSPRARAELVWRGGESVRGPRRAAQIAAGFPIEGSSVVPDEVAGALKDLVHGSIVTAECSYQAGRGYRKSRFRSQAWSDGFDIHWRQCSAGSG